ncbi:MAG TPA: cytochrome C nitrite reductase [Burkholderiales bacterium]|nr:cytochrome C nitrite reductase [Burkholderiales bacterium]
MTRLLFFMLSASVLISPDLATAADLSPGETPKMLVEVPGQPLRSFDIGVVDEADNIYALADRSNNGIDLIDTRTEKFLGRVGGFAGSGKRGSGGPNGLALADHGRLWAGDGDSIKVVDVRTRKVVDTIYTGGRKRVDEMAVDSRDHLVIAANDADDPPFLTFISDNRDHRVEGRLTLRQASGGLEQPVWDGRRNLVYVAMPEVDGIAGHGAIAVIDPVMRRLVRMITVPKCRPAGMALGARDRLLVGCRNENTLIIDPGDGRIVSAIREVGGADEVWYDGKHYYVAAAANRGGPVLGVIDARTGRWVANIPTEPHAHSVAADSGTGRVFVPIAAGKGLCHSGCIAVFVP